MRMSLPIGVLLVSAALISTGCGGDDDKADKPASPSAATDSSGADSSDAPLKIEDVKTQLEAAGYKVKEEPGTPLLRNEASPGGIVKSEVELTVTGGELPSGTDVEVHSFSNPEDVAAVKELAAGGESSLVKGDLFFQAAEPGAADTVAEAAG